MWRFGFSLFRLQNLSKRPCAPCSGLIRKLNTLGPRNFTRLYRALRDGHSLKTASFKAMKSLGATYVHPREILSTLGHNCLCLTQRPADQWLVREMGISGSVVQELAEPGMRCRWVIQILLMDWVLKPCSNMSLCPYIINMLSIINKIIVFIVNYTRHV